MCDKIGNYLFYVMFEYGSGRVILLLLEKYKCGRPQIFDEKYVNWLSKEFFKWIKFKYNFDETDEDYIFGGSELLIIDLENKQSYIRWKPKIGIFLYILHM